MVNTARNKVVSTVGGIGKTAVKASDDPQRALKNKGIVNSGCSRHMTSNKGYLVDYQYFNGGPVAFGGSKGQITGKENLVPSEGLTCLIAKATTDESNKWHRTLGHVNFKNLNKLVKGNLVRGLPSKIFQNDHTCVACQKGKQHRPPARPK
ncbi:ribonuclease H-like domain-containing protein [Tanacetum coccineum]